MSVLLETNLGGDIVIDLDLEGSPILCKNILKLAKIRYYTSCLVYNVQRNRFFQTGDPTGTGQGGACVYGVLDAAGQASHATTTTTKSTTIENSDNKANARIQASQKRFLKSSSGRRLTLNECHERGRVVAMELPHTKDTIGSQFTITLGQSRPGDALDGYFMGNEYEDSNTRPLSLGIVTEDDEGILEKIEASYCDNDGRPYADIRILRVLVLHDPFPDPPGLWEYLADQQGMVIESGRILASPDRSKPPQETVPERISVSELDMDVDETEEQVRARKEREARQEDHQRAVVLELLGDLPSADYKAPEHVLFVCKLNPITQDEDLELIFSRFDPNCKAEIIRDHDTGNSLQYAFVEFSTKQQCVEAYFKMNNVLVDDRRIKVDFSQSVAKLWDKHTQRLKARATKGIMQSPHSPSESQSLRVNRGGKQDENYKRISTSRQNYGARHDFGGFSGHDAKVASSKDQGAWDRSVRSSFGSQGYGERIVTKEQHSKDRRGSLSARNDIPSRARGAMDLDSVDRRRDKHKRKQHKKDLANRDGDDKYRRKKHRKRHCHGRGRESSSSESHRGELEASRRRRDEDSFHGPGERKKCNPNSNEDQNRNDNNDRRQRRDVSSFNGVSKETSHHLVGVSTSSIENETGVTAERRLWSGERHERDFDDEINRKSKKRREDRDEKKRRKVDSHHHDDDYYERMKWRYSDDGDENRRRTRRRDPKHQQEKRRVDDHDRHYHSPSSSP